MDHSIPGIKWLTIVNEHLACSIQTFRRKATWLRRTLAQIRGTAQTTISHAELDGWENFIFNMETNMEQLSVGILEEARTVAIGLESVSLQMIEKNLILNPTREPSIKGNPPGKTTIEQALSCTREAIYYLISYTDIPQSFRNKIVEAFGAHICPYCEEHSIRTVVDSNSDIKRVTDLDHWYSKNQHPALQKNYRNLIPSCSICNNLKRDKTQDLTTHFYAGNDNYLPKNIKFNVSISTINGQQNYEVLMSNYRPGRSSFFDRSLKSAKEICLAERYARHRALIDDVIQRTNFTKKLNSIGYTELMENLSISAEELKAILLGESIGTNEARTLVSFREDLVRQFIS